MALHRVYGVIFVTNIQYRSSQCVLFDPQKSFFTSVSRGGGGVCKSNTYSSFDVLVSGLSHYRRSIWRHIGVSQKFTINQVQENKAFKHFVLWHLFSSSVQHNGRWCTSATRSVFSASRWTRMISKANTGGFHWVVVYRASTPCTNILRILLRMCVHSSDKPTCL